VGVGGCTGVVVWGCGGWCCLVCSGVGGLGGVGVWGCGDVGFFFWGGGRRDVGVGGCTGVVVWGVWGVVLSGVWWCGGFGGCGGVGFFCVFSPCARTFQGLHSVRLWTPTILNY
jgi:hypothetical protein